MSKMTREELLQLLKTAVNASEINDRREEIAGVIPQIRIMFDFDQQNRAHQYDLWMHCVHTVLNLPREKDDDMLYLAALLHDIGKPDCQCRGTKPEDTNMHYYGHPHRSMEIVRDYVLPEWKRQSFPISPEEAVRLLYYVEYHDDRMSMRLKHVRQHVNMVSFREFQNLMLLQVADAKAHVQLPIIEERVKTCEALAGEEGRKLYERILNGE